MNATDTVRADLIEPYFQTRHPCSVCGGHTDKVAVVVQVVAPNSKYNNFRVCETCLRAGDLDARMDQHANKLEAMAAALRALRGRLITPTFAEWKHAEELATALQYADADASFDEALTWPREKQDATIAEAKAQWAQEDAASAARRVADLTL